MKKYLILLTLAILAACTKEVADDLRPADGRYSMTVIASKVGTKALALSGSTLNATWTAGDKVNVYKADTKIGELTACEVSGASAKLRGTLDLAPSVNDVLTLKFLSPSYSTQDGTLTGSATSIDKVCDYATATVTVNSIDGGNITIKEASANFENRQAIVKFTLIKKDDNSDLVIPAATALTVNDGSNDHTVTPASATNVLFVAIPATGTVNLSTTIGGIDYSYNKTAANLLAGKYYEITVKMASTGILPGKFTINSGGGKVNFSKGNLQYQASTGTWRFAPNQYDMIGSDNANISDSYTGWIDLLGWGTGNAPTKSSTSSGDYSTFTDWGVNAISNGGNTANMWSTLTKDEWDYLFGHHTKAWSTVNGVNGYVIRPDGISTAVAASYTASEWATEEAAGSVFLPAACSRGGTTFNAGSWGDYWSSTPTNSADAYYLYFHQGGQNPANSACRWGGRSVRLVYETPYFQGAGTEADPYLITSEADWNYLAIKVNSGTSYAGKFFRQTANIDVTTMVGVSDLLSFSGTYDGDGNTLNLNLNTSTSHTAPFRYIVDATIKNVVTTGTVHSTSNHPSGLVGFTDGTCIIQNCRVSADVGGAQHSGGIVGHCYHANISIIGCVYSGTLSPASGQWTGGIIGWGGDDGGHTISISNCLFAGDFVYSTSSTKFHPIGILQNQSNTKYLSNTYYTLGAQNTNDDASFVKGLDYKGKFAHSITAGTDVTAVANAGAATEYDVSGITSYGTGILYDGVLYAGNGEEVSLTLSHGAAPTGFVFSQYTVTGGGTLANPTTNSPTLTMSDANQTINVQWTFTQTFNYTGASQTFTAPATGYYTLECHGAQGGAFTTTRGGYGGTSQLTYLLTQGDVLYIYVGGQGGSIAEYKGLPDGGNGGWNGGGKGGTGVKHRNVESETPWSGGGGGYVGGNTWVVQYNEPHQCYSGAGGSSWGETTNGKGYSTTTGGATAGGNGKAVITWYGTTYPVE